MIAAWNMGTAIVVLLSFALASASDGAAADEPPRDLAEAAAIAALRRINPFSVAEQMRGVALELQNPTAEQADLVAKVGPVWLLGMRITKPGTEWQRCLENAQGLNWLRISVEQNVDLTTEPARPFRAIGPVDEVHLDRLDLGPARWKSLTGALAARRLSLWNVPLPPESTRALADVAGLKVLLIKDSTLTGEGLDAFDGKSLEWLDLDHTRLSDGGVAAIARVGTLRQVNLAVGGDVTESGVIVLSSMEQLEGISFDRVPVSDETIALFRRCPRLTHFGVRYAPGVTGRTLYELQHLPLVGVGFESTGLDDRGFQALAEVPTLNHFNVDHTRITGDSLKRLEGRREGFVLIANGTGIAPDAAGEFARRHPAARMFVDKKGDASYHFAEGRLAHRIPARGSPGYREIDGK